jgi:hypothetical protein
MGGHSAGRNFDSFEGVHFLSYKERIVKPIGKSPSARGKATAKPVRAKKLPNGEVAGPDERRPETKADEIYGDTKIPERSRKK